MLPASCLAIREGGFEEILLDLLEACYGNGFVHLELGDDGFRTIVSLPVEKGLLRREATALTLKTALKEVLTGRREVHRCSKCGLERTLDQFSKCRAKSSTTPGYRQAWYCLMCDKSRARKRKAA
jgi:hypothetical protein